MTDKALSMIGLATKAGKIASGEFAVESAVRKGKAVLVISASDASDNTKKSFNLNYIDEALTMRPARYEELEKVSVKKQKEIIFEDELEEKRIADNYVFIMKNLISALHKKEAFTLEEFNLSMKNMYSENVLKNADYFSFFVNLCQKKKHITGGADMDSESFMDDILKKYFENEAPVVFSIDEGNGKMLELMDGCEVSDITFHREDYSN